ncbi:hypothetical protein [Mahella australiensis]|uniref:Uncharacterized protein n=1 Tax=Mahella australiensis (strain DSM 15567 / CIP 107919 / 50-1 BON) TaxID=697281 RepID=F3ZYK4_MAHA5|nr:hypothetical protein [Mahella australiensis]AEE97772.1 hypothetical protein Mahau_2632 [Mahella australiensis 50-1 BON]
MTTAKKHVITISILILISLALIIVIAVNFFPKPMIHGDYPYYPDVKSITNAADVIIVGEVVSAKDVQDLMVDRTPNKTNKETTPYTISTVKVVEVVKGNVNIGEIITIKQLGDYKAKPEATLHEMNGYLSKDTEQLMFLCEYDDSPYSPVNPAQGIIKVRNGTTLYSANEYSLFGYTATSAKTADSLDSAIAMIKDCID